MEVRLAKKRDKRAVLRLLDELGEEINKKKGYSPHNAEAEKVGSPIFSEVISRKDTMIFVADENGKLLGLITFYILPSIRHGSHRGHIEDVVVSQTARRRGVGTLLFNSIKKYCKENGIKVIKLDSAIYWKGAHKFYKKIGGKVTDKMFRFDI